MRAENLCHRRLPVSQEHPTPSTRSWHDEPRLEWAWLICSTRSWRSTLRWSIPYPTRSPAYEAMLSRQPLRFLLSGDPAAGETIMAGLLIKELIARGDLQRLLRTRSLAQQWPDQLDPRCRLPVEILTNAKPEPARGLAPRAPAPLAACAFPHLSSRNITAPRRCLGLRQLLPPRNLPLLILDNAAHPHFFLPQKNLRDHDGRAEFIRPQSWDERPCPWGSAKSVLPPNRSLCRASVSGNPGVSRHVAGREEPSSPN